MRPKRVEKEVAEWIKFMFEVVYGVFMTFFYIFKEWFELIVPSQSKSLVGQHVLVTGAARGLGREICLRLVKEGVRLSCVDILMSGAEETATLCNTMRKGCATAHSCDITDKAQVGKLAESLAPVDVLINNAGIVSSSDILGVSDEQLDRMMQVNVMAHFWTIRAFLPGMLTKGNGHIVGVASAASFTAAANIAPYTATKYAVTGMMASLREEFRLFHPEIKTTTIHPFFITPPASSVEHWEKKSRIPDVSAVYVADKTVRGIKKEKLTVTIPWYLYFLLALLQTEEGDLKGAQLKNPNNCRCVGTTKYEDSKAPIFLPSAAGELWRDLFYARISPIEKRKTKTS